MWWRKDSCYLDVISELDGTITATKSICRNTGLASGLAAPLSVFPIELLQAHSASAFVETIDRCIRDALSTMVMDSLVQDVAKHRQEVEIRYVSDSELARPASGGHASHRSVAKPA